jgi:hypothetical protein
MIYTITILSTIISFSLTFLLLKERKKNKESKKHLNKEVEKDLYIAHIIEEKEMAEAELRIIKNIYRNKLLNLIDKKDDVA